MPALGVVSRHRLIAAEMRRGGGAGGDPSDRFCILSATRDLRNADATESAVAFNLAFTTCDRRPGPTRKRSILKVSFR